METRIDRTRAAMEALSIGALIITPGPDLRWLTGYDAKPLERLTALVVRADKDPVLVVPELEVAAARASGVEVELVSWAETDDPFAAVGRLVRKNSLVAVDNHMWASRLYALQERIRTDEWTLAGPLLEELRLFKDRSEIDALREAGAAIDRVHDRMGEWLRAGRTEREVGRDIAAAILDEGHVSVDFVIVGSGPNGASPHHDVSDRVIEAGDPVVIDIGGTTAAGYCSDSTRNYLVGGEPTAQFRELYDVLLAAQEAQRQAVAPGIKAADLDQVGRDIIDEAGFGENFIHRTGHGIGVETHEEPYIVQGNTRQLAPSMAFSIEPGIYIDGHYGARIEDIVVCTRNGSEVLNNTERELRILP